MGEIERREERMPEGEADLADDHFQRMIEEGETEDEAYPEDVRDEEHVPEFQVTLVFAYRPTPPTWEQASTMAMVAKETLEGWDDVSHVRYDIQELREP